MHTQTYYNRDTLPKPIERSPLRLKLGSIYYSARRHALWMRPGAKYARRVVDSTRSFEHVAFAHESFLLRELKNVDMWLQHNKVNNLKLAIQKLDGVVIQPGETFSFWRLVGRPAKHKGFLKGMVLTNGGFKPGWGGGLCQLSNLIYWMTLHTPLTVTERFRHQYDVFPDSKRTLPFGSGATVSYNYIDLQIRNGTNAPFCLHLSLSETHLIGEWRTKSPLRQTYEVYEKHHAITQEFSSVYIRHNQIWRRTFAENGDLADDCLVTENHAIMMYSPLLSPPSN